MSNHVLAKVTTNAGELKARLRVASFCAVVVSWAPIPMSWKHAAADWLLEWAMKPGVKVKVD